MNLQPTVLIGLFSFVGALASAFMAYRSSSQANRTNDKKVDAEAFERSQQFYEKLLAEADKAVDRLRGQVERLQDQLERVSQALNTEQDSSNVLRTHVRTLQQQVAYMEATLTVLRTQLAPNQLGPVNLPTSAMPVQGLPPEPPTGL